MFDFIKQNPFLWLIVFLLVVSPSFLFGAFQVIAVIIFVVLILIVLGVLLLRWKIYSMQKQMNGGGATNRSAGSSSQSSTYGSKQERDVKIYPSQQEKRVADNVGDYVEFEEVKEERK